MEIDAHKKIVDCLSALGMSALSGVLGYEKTERLQSLGLRLNSKTIAEFLVSSVGPNIFRRQEIRLLLLESMDPKVLESFASVLDVPVVVAVEETKVVLLVICH